MGRIFVVIGILPVYPEHIVPKVFEYARLAVPLTASAVAFSRRLIEAVNSAR